MIFWLNSIPHKNGINPTLSPYTIITGSIFDYKTHCTLQSVEFAQVHENHNNSLMPCTAGAIALCLTDNGQAI